MGYNAKDAQEVQGIPAGESAQGVVINIVDGEVKDFVTNMEGWRGDPSSKAINIQIETTYNGNSFTLSRVFTYKKNKEGKTEYASTSNLGKYKAYYNKLPEVGDKVKLLSNKEGFFRLLIE